MSEDTPDARSTLALNTRLEDSFVSPLTAIRGALEILRDFPDLTDDERARFVTGALEECARLEAGIEDLGASVYAAADREAGQARPEIDERFAGRIAFDADTGLADLDFSDFEFNASALVNAFHDAIEAAANATGRRWVFLVDMNQCRVWPEAWVAFAHRGKKLSMNFSTGVLRYGDAGDYGSRDEAAVALKKRQG